MLRVLFFAAVREELGCSSAQLEWSAAAGGIHTLIDQLAAQHGARHAEVLRRENTVVAVNQEVVRGDHPLHDGDEVAFFPPVTGG